MSKSSNDKTIPGTKKQLPQKADKKPTKNRQKAVLEMAVFQYASSALHQYANPSPAGQSRKALLMGPV